MVPMSGFKKFKAWPKSRKKLKRQNFNPSVSLSALPSSVYLITPKILFRIIPFVHSVHLDLTASQVVKFRWGNAMNKYDVVNRRCIFCLGYCFDEFYNKWYRIGQDTYDMRYGMRCMIWYDIWYMLYDMICYVIWYLIWYIIWCDVIWYMISYDIIWYNIWCHMIWCYIIWYHMISFDMMLYHMISYDIIWYDTSCHTI